MAISFSSGHWDVSRRDVCTLIDRISFPISCWLECRCDGRARMDQKADNYELNIAEQQDRVMSGSLIVRDLPFIVLDYIFM